ncbi:MAG TPA: pyrroloquinoline quinone biosynthesis protein PqqB [Terriglobia bacterium]|nr:pyrroloquinoline quinone biosynthesis protein PqqB [Terriglobia bacterium]
MRIKILGSAAGGGFPQWNCACSNCRRLRERRFPGVARTQAQLAWQSESGLWTLLNASPDLRTQIEATSELWPQDGSRHSPISDVILTGAEVDQTIGLLLLREFHSFRVHATHSVRRILTEDNSIFGVLRRYAGQACWKDIPLEAPFSVGGARLEAVPLGGSFPGFIGGARQAESDPAEAVIGLWITPVAAPSSPPEPVSVAVAAVSPPPRKTLAFLPGVGSIPDSLLERLQQCDVLLFDGTFWSDEEPASIPGLGKTASQMGHMPVSGARGSLASLAGLDRARKIFIHINNTNPILDEESAEYRAVRDAGWEVARDGMEITL